MRKRLYSLTILLAIVLLSVTLAGCTDNDGDDDGDDGGQFEITITINGQEFNFLKLLVNQTSVEIKASDGKNYTGIPLLDIIDLAPPTDKENQQYQIEAEDGYTKNVTWEDIKKGIITSHTEDHTMTVFPHLPGKYRIRNVKSIKPVTTPTLSVVGALFTWDQPFDMFDERIVEDNESNTYEGVSLSDLVNTSGISEPETHNFTIVASDNYSKEVTWDDMMNGILVKDERKSVFPEKEKKYWIKDIVRIEVV